MLPWACSVIDHREHQNVVKTSVTNLPVARVPLLFFLPHFDVICDLLLNRRMATWNLFVKYDWLHFCPGNPNCNWASMLSGLLARLTTLRKNEIYGSLYTFSEKPHYIK